MTFEEKARLARHGDISDAAVSLRLTVARTLANPSQKAFADQLGINQKTYNSMEKRGAPSREVMRELYRAHRIDFNFIIYGDFVQLPGDVQERIFRALAAHAPS